MWMGIRRQVFSWQGEIQWAAVYAKGKSAHDMIYRMAFAGSIYFIWIERTKGYFKVRRGQVFGWQGEIQWSAVYAKGKSAHDMIYRMAFAGSIDFIWIERNRRLFQGKKRTEESIARQFASFSIDSSKAQRSLEYIAQQLTSLLKQALDHYAGLKHKNHLPSRP
ncbi:hypothetical protein HAX54_048861 [Datura stramonium]|uniref:Uncharacterized protein n=1 Tax=Datura stramonium TaxID=4076 RepID=A0ABS8WLQ8_DATST|nr:hypothetical protein [Datura stramonium]